MVAMLCGWSQREQEEVIAFLREENRVLKAQLAGRRLRLDDSERRRLAELGHRPGRHLLADVATMCAGRVVICDRDPKWSGAMEELLRTVGVRVVRTPASAPNCNAHAERFIRSIKTECLDRVVPLGERHLRHLVREFVNHYHTERNHQGIGNELIERPLVQRTGGPARRRWRAGGVLNYYYRSAA